MSIRSTLALIAIAALSACAAGREFHPARQHEGRRRAI